MPPKSASKGKGDKKGAAKAEPVEDPAEAQFKKLAKVYKTKCTELSLQDADHASVYSVFKKVLTAEEPQYPRSFIFSQPVNSLACQALCSSLESSRYERLKTLSFWNCDLGDAAGKAVAQVLRHITTLNKLEMIDCQLSKATCDALGYELGRSGSYHVSILRLDNNRFGPEGAKLLCAGLAKHPTLKTLSLACCEVGAEGAIAVADMVKAKNIQLKTLNLEGNDLGNLGVQTLAAGIESNSSLTDLNISFNRVGTSAAESSPLVDTTETKQPSGVSTMASIVKALSQCKSLGQLNMTGNLLNDEEAEVLVKGIETPALSHVYVLKVSGTIKKELIERLIKSSLEHKPAPVKGGKKKGGKKKKKK